CGPELLIDKPCEAVEFLFGGRIVFEKAFREPDCAERHAEQGKHLCMVANGEFHASSANIHEQAKWRIEFQTAQNAEADETRLIFLRKHFKGDPDSGDVFNERRAVASFPHGAGCSRTKGRNPVTIGNAFESLQRVE